MSVLLAILLAVTAASGQQLPEIGTIYQTFGVVPPSWDPSQENDRTDDAWLALALGDHRQAVKDVAGAREDVAAALARAEVDAGTAATLSAQHDYIERCAGVMARYWAALADEDYRAAAELAAEIRKTLPPSGVTPALYLRALNQQLAQLDDLAGRLITIDAARDAGDWRAAMKGAWELTDDAGEAWSLWRMTDAQLKLIEEQMGAVYTAGDAVMNPNPLLSLKRR